MIYLGVIVAVLFAACFLLILIGGLLAASKKYARLEILEWEAEQADRTNGPLEGSA